MNIDLSNGKLKISSPIIGGYNKSISNGSFELDNLEEFVEKFKKMCEDEIFKDYFDIETKKLKIKKELYEFNCILEFLISVQSIYAPYGRSSAKSLQIIRNAFDPDTWEEKRRKFDPERELEALDLDIKMIFYYYQIFSMKTNYLLGDGRAHDWIQLWKSIRWYKKDLLEGSLRLGVEYLQWALMHKRFIEDYLGKDIPDVDEIIKTSIDFALECDTNKITRGWNLRGSRNERLSDDNNSYYDDIYKRLFYLANDFGLDYQPRVIVFVEGATEMEIMPEFFNWYLSRPETLGIEFMNFEGVDKLLSTSKTSADLKHLIHDIQNDIRDKAISSNHHKKLNAIINKLKNIDIIISNWTSFISYNLENWQIIPFFVSDNEGNIKHFLEAEYPIKYECNNYNIPTDWKFLWGIDNKDKPFSGSSFELANFSDNEIALAMGEITQEKIDEKLVKSIRDNGEGVNKISEKIELPGNKIKLNRILYRNLLNKFNENMDKSIFERPIFKLIEKISRIAALNHLPVDRQVEIENKKRIKEILEGDRHLV